MPMKRRAGGRPKRDDDSSTQPFAGHVAVRAGDIRGIRVSEPQAGHGPVEIHRMVVVFVPADWHRHRVGDVSTVAVKRTGDPRIN